MNAVRLHGERPPGVLRTQYVETPKRPRRCEDDHPPLPDTWGLRWYPRRAGQYLCRQLAFKNLRAHDEGVSV